jgi:hypothetical protein
MGRQFLIQSVNRNESCEEWARMSGALAAERDRQSASEQERQKEKM